jgi:hypothetical protein
MDYWCESAEHKVGPYPTRKEALDAFRARYPFRGADYEANARRNQIATGYGRAGAWFDIRWHSARAD